MSRAELERQLRQLGIYSDFYYRKELAPLCRLLSEGERLECVFTGVNEADRKLAAITENRIIIVFAGALGSGDVKVIAKSAVRQYSFEKRFLFSRASFSTENEEYVFRNVEGKTEKLFNEAMSRIR